MDTKLLLIFIALNITNVIIQTIKSLVTVKCGKTAAALINAAAYGLYTVVVIYTVCELPLYLKALIVAICNLVGVYVVKLIEERARRDKLWEVRATVKGELTGNLCSVLNHNNIPHNYILNIGKYTIFNIYCETQKESIIVKAILEQFNAKYFVSESKTL